VSRIKLDIPQPFIFKTSLTVRIGDINYGNHLSNDVYLTYMHEARVRFFEFLGLKEMDIGGCAVIMGDCAIVYKAECRFGDVINIHISVADFGARSFDIYYRFIRESDEFVVCEGKTGMVCFDYSIGKTMAVPESFKLTCISAGE